MKGTELFIVDDHPVFIKGVTEIFNPETDNIFVGGSANAVVEAREKLQVSAAAIILLDLKLPGESGLDFCIEAKSRFPDKKVIVLTGETDPEILFKVWVNGADAIISKLAGKEQLVSTIHAVLEGQRILGPNLPPLFDHLQSSSGSRFLTRRENQVFTLLISGKQRNEVAEMLNISIDTVDKHCSNVYRKFGVKNLSGFIREAKKQNITL